MFEEESELSGRLVRGESVLGVNMVREGLGDG